MPSWLIQPMKTYLKNLSVLPAVLVAFLSLTLAGRVAAQTFTTLHSFTATAPGGTCANSDGAHPEGRLVLSGNTLYGTAFEGGISGAGTMFAINTNGTGYTNLHSFTASSYPNYPYTNSD